jgi:hypothetical protein
MCIESGGYSCGICDKVEENSIHFRIEDLCAFDREVANAVAATLPSQKTPRRDNTFRLNIHCHKNPTITDAVLFSSPCI